jgi:glutamate-ammonia-ligase adenylyltransferase
MSQQLISLLTVPTREGKLYEVDMRLRPSGRAGPVAVTLDRLKTYHETEAWTYELMSLTRARVVYGAPGLGAKVEAGVRAILTAPRDAAKLSADAVEMRARLEGAKPVHDPWSIKLARGGLMDLDYIAQILELALAAREPELLHSATHEVFEALGRLGLVPAADADALAACWRTLAGVSQVMRISAETEARPEKPNPSLEARLAEAAGAASFAAVEPRLIDTEARVRELFEKYVCGLRAQFPS